MDFFPCAISGSWQALKQDFDRLLDPLLDSVRALIACSICAWKSGAFMRPVRSPVTPPGLTSLHILSQSPPGFR